jgi:hypothetical protein
MKRALAIWLGASAVGIALIALLPEGWLGEARLLSLSAHHGPSPSDAVGLAFVLAGWAVYLRALWSHRRNLAPRPASAWLAAAAVAALAGCLAAVAADRDGWALGLGIAAFVSQLALGCMTRKEA